LAIQQFDEKAKRTKDIAAAGVLVLAIGTVTIFAAILVHNAETIFANPAAITRQVIVGVPLTFFGGALMHESAKPAWLDVLFAVGAFAVWLVTLEWTESYVFWAMTAGLLVVMANAAYLRHRARA
jgi:diacylglycerol kinase (ATP)